MVPRKVLDLKGLGTGGSGLGVKLWEIMSYGLLPSSGWRWLGWKSPDFARNWRSKTPRSGTSLGRTAHGISAVSGRRRKIAFLPTSVAKGEGRAGRERDGSWRKKEGGRACTASQTLQCKHATREIKEACCATFSLFGEEIVRPEKDWGSLGRFPKWKTPGFTTEARRARRIDDAGVGERKPGCRVPHSRPSFGLEWGAIRRDDPAPPHIRGFRMCGKRRSGPSLIRAEPVSGPGFSRRGQFIANGGDPTGRGSRERAHPAFSAQPPQRAQPRCSLGTPVRRCTLG